VGICGQEAADCRWPLLLKELRVLEQAEAEEVVDFVIGNVVFVAARDDLRDFCGELAQARRGEAVEVRGKDLPKDFAGFNGTPTYCAVADGTAELSFGYVGQ
jgi:hypothetical protein